MLEGGTRPRGALRKMIDLLASLLSAWESDQYEGVPGVEVLAHVVESRGETRAEFARAMGISPQVVSNVLNGERGISKNLAVKLSKRLHLEASVFLGVAS